MAKIQFTAKAIKDAKAIINKEHKSFSSCLRTVKENWTVFSKIARKDGFTAKDLNPAYFVKWLDGSNYCQNGVLGRMVTTDKENKIREFVAWETWTPGRVMDFARRASAAHFRALISK